MPFSRSRSPESITRSTRAWFAAERAGLAEHRVDERGLAVVDVGDDRDVAEVVADGGGRSGRGVGRDGGGHGGAGRVTHGPAKCRTWRRFGRTPRPAGLASATREDGPHGLEVRRRDEAAVEELDHAVGDLDHHRVVGRDDRGHALGADDGPDQQHDLLAGLGVELAGRLVGEQEPRPVRERAGDRDALLLAARELVRPVLRPRLEARRARAAPRPAGRAPSGPRRPCAAAPRRSRPRSGSGSGRTSGTRTRPSAAGRRPRRPRRGRRCVGPSTRTRARASARRGRRAG